MAVISNCDAIGAWTTENGSLSIDTSDKKEGTGSLKDNVVPSATKDAYYKTKYDSTGSWDLSGNNYILFWLKSDRVDTAFSVAELTIHDTLGSNRYWDLTFAAGVWTAQKKLLSTGDGSGTPDLTSIESIRVTFRAKDTTAFYKKIDNVWVSKLPYDTSFTMTMDMKL